jgi:hypothetical protein
MSKDELIQKYFSLKIELEKLEKQIKPDLIKLSNELRDFSNNISITIPRKKSERNKQLLQYKTLAKQSILITSKIVFWLNFITVSEKNIPISLLLQDSLRCEQHERKT